MREEVELETRAQGFLVEIKQHALDRGSRIGDENIETTKAPDDFADGLIGGALCGEIGNHGETVRPYRSSSCLAGLLVEIDQGYCRAFPGKGLGGREPDGAGAAGDRDDLPGKGLGRRL
jgi:hypothetical protein